MWRHLGFCGNVRSGTAARVPPQSCHLQARRAAGPLSLMLWGVVASAIPRRTQTEKPVKCKLKGSEKVQHLYLFYCFTSVLFSFGIQQAVSVSLVLSRLNFLFRFFGPEYIATALLPPPPTPPLQHVPAPRDLGGSALSGSGLNAELGISVLSLLPFFLFLDMFYRSNTIIQY